MASYTPGTHPHGPGQQDTMGQQPYGAGWQHSGAPPYDGGPAYGGGGQYGAAPQYGGGPRAGSPAPVRGAAPGGMPGVARAAGQPWRPYGNVRRTGYGLLWGFYTAVLVIGGFATLFGGNAAGLLAVALGILAGYYDWKIWTFRARRLWFVIIW